MRNVSSEGEKKLCRRKSPVKGIFGVAFFQLQFFPFHKRQLLKITQHKKNALKNLEEFGLGKKVAADTIAPYK